MCKTDIEKLEVITANLSNIIANIETFHAEPVVSAKVVEGEAKFIRKFLIVALILVVVNLILEVTQFFV